MGDEANLPADDTNLETNFTGYQYTVVESDDANRVEQCATDEYTIFQFKDKNNNNTDKIIVHWNGQTDIAPSQSTVYLQIYNQNTSTWEAIDNDSTTGASTDFDLDGALNTNVGNYYDAEYWVTWRVYQLA